MKTNRTITAAMTLALALGLSACGDDDAGTGAQEDTPTAVEQTTPAEDTTPADTTDDSDDTAGTDGTTGAAAAGDVTEQAFAAIDAAESEVGGTAYGIDDQDDDGGFEVDVRVGDRSFEVEVAADGSVTESEEDDLDSDDRAALDAATITLREAIEIAIGEAGGVLDDAELESDDGQFYWEVTVDGSERGDDVEVLVSVDGQVLEVEED